MIQTPREPPRGERACSCAPHRLLVFLANLVAPVLHPIFDDLIEIAHRAAAGDDVGDAIVECLVEGGAAPQIGRRVVAQGRVLDGIAQQHLLLRLSGASEFRELCVVEDRQVLHDEVVVDVSRIRRSALCRNGIVALVPAIIGAFDPVVDQERLLTPEWRRQKVEDAQQLANPLWRRAS